MEISLLLDKVFFQLHWTVVYNQKSLFNNVMQVYLYVSGVSGIEDVKNMYIFPPKSAHASICI